MMISHTPGSENRPLPAVESAAAALAESNLQDLFANLPCSSVQPLACYTSRPSGFLDILLTRQVLSSEQVFRLLGEVHTHRDNGSSAGRDFTARNRTISFSVGLVSFRYFDRAIKERASFTGGYGVAVPFSELSTFRSVSFSHASTAGGIINFNLNRDNFVSTWHTARAARELEDDGYGNVFEVLLEAETDSRNAESRGTQFPGLPIEPPVTVLLPECERSLIGERLQQRREEYEHLRAKLWAHRDEIRPIILDDREISCPRESFLLVEGALSRPALTGLTIDWYRERNLELALRRLSCRMTG